MEAQPTHAKKGFVAAAIGTVLVALCCFTPLLVLVLGALGLGVAGWIPHQRSNHGRKPSNAHVHHGWTDC